MPLFNLVLRQYTPPTCTLEIKARESPLSRWVGLKVFNQLRFQLSFDDPRQSEEKRITIWGDRAELEALCDAVTSYVQNFLDQPPPQVPLGLLASADGSMPDNGNSYNSQAIPEPRFNSYPTQNAAAYDPLATTTEQSEEEQEQGYAPEVERPPLLGLSPTPYLQPRGLLAHDLFLGALQTEDSGPVVTLSALQLFDLATAMDEYAAEVVALPKINRRFNLQDRPTWTYAAAGGLVAVVGLALAVGQVLKRPATKTAVLTPTTQSNLAQQTPLPGQVLPLQTPPLPNSTGPTPLVPNSTGATPLVPNSAGSRGLVPNLSGQTPLGQTSQVPPPLGTPLPPTAGIQQPGGSNSFPMTAPQTSSGGFNTSKTSRPSFSVAPAPRQQQRATTTATRSSTPARPASRPQQRAATTATRSSTPARSASRPQQRAATTANRPSTPTRSAPSIANLPSIPNTSSSPRQSVKLGDRTLPNVTASPVIPPIASNFDPNPQTLSSDLVPSIGSNGSLSSSGAGDTSALQQRSEAASESNSNNVARGSIDTIPQVAETKNYLQQRWKPPQGLTQPLEYTLLIGGDGAIERIIPRTQAAKNYIDRTGMPIVGEKFVSPIEGGGNPQIRVVLNPDGKVATFVEQ